MARLLSLPLVTPLPAHRQCPISVISVQLVGSAGQRLQELFLDREGHISAQPHLVPRDEALILAANQQILLGDQGLVQVH